MGLFVDFDTLQGSVGCQLNTIFAVNRTRQGYLPTDHFVCLPQKFLPHTVKLVNCGRASVGEFNKLPFYRKHLCGPKS